MSHHDEKTRERLTFGKHKVNVKLQRPGRLREPWLGHFASGHFPRDGGQFHPMRIDLVMRSVVGFFVGGLFLVLGCVAAPVLTYLVVSEWTENIEKLRRTLHGKEEIAIAALLAAAGFGLFAYCMHIGFWALASLWLAIREARARKRGASHFGIWIDSEVLALKLLLPIGAPKCCQIERSALVDAGKRTVRTRASSYELVYFKHRDQTGSIRTLSFEEQTIQGGAGALLNQLHDWNTP